MGFAILAYSMPSFWKGIILIWIFGVYLGWFPTMGYVHMVDLTYAFLHPKIRVQ